jgi:hypothetical protein
MGAIVIRTRYDEGTESAEVATSDMLHHMATILVCYGGHFESNDALIKLYETL